MPTPKKVTIVRTSQTAETLKLMLGGRVVASVVVVDSTTAELRDGGDRLFGTYPDAAAAIAAYEKSIAFEEIGLDL